MKPIWLFTEEGTFNRIIIPVGDSNWIYEQTGTFKLNKELGCRLLEYAPIDVRKG